MAPHLPDADRPSHATLTARPETSQLPMRSLCSRTCCLRANENSRPLRCLIFRTRYQADAWLNPTPHAIAVYLDSEPGSRVTGAGAYTATCAVTHPRQEPYAGKPHVRFCAGGVR